MGTIALLWMEGREKVQLRLTFGSKDFSSDEFILSVFAFSRTTAGLGYLKVFRLGGKMSPSDSKPVTALSCCAWDMDTLDSLNDNSA